ncbi:MAG: HDOD domain-containing protein [Terracidiphilus sp.]|nr:HDOD domain-containing protein [Terracidiphilus sp.]
MVDFTSDSEERPIRYAARQPILAIDETVIGYKLLFRTNAVDHFSAGDASRSSRAAIDASALLGLNVLCDNRLAFIGCTRDVLLESSLTSLPADRVVAEIPSDVTPDKPMQDALRSLKDAGFKLSLNDFSHNDPREPLTPFVDFLKVDIKSRSWEEIERIAAAHDDHEFGLVAENVETWEDFDHTRSIGFHYFQGFFFRKPETMRTRVATAHQTTYLRLLRAVSRPELDWAEVEDLIKRDPAIYFRLMRYINSPLIGLRNEVRSISQALALLGENELRRWCRTAGAFAMSRNRPSDLMLSALVRGRFSELLGAQFDHGTTDLFLVGLLSLMDTILEIPMRVIIEGLPLDDAARKLLLENTGPLHPLYELVWAIEHGAWGPVVRFCRKLGLGEDMVAESYSSAMQWAQAINTTS